MKLTTHQYELPLRHTFAISRESYSSQPTLIVELSDGGHSGFGEATTNPYYQVTQQTMRDSLARVQEQLQAFSLQDNSPEDLWQTLDPTLKSDRFAQCALDQAAWDLWGKLRGTPVYQAWGLSLQSVPASCYTIGIAEIDTMVMKLNEMPGWPVYKIKLGTTEDVEIIRSLRQHTDAVFRVDANCAWGVDETLRNAEQLAQLGVEFIEQPLRADDWDGHRQVFERSALPVLADESCIHESDVQRCAGHFHGVNIKLVKCGGLTPARRMIAEAKSLGMQVMVGCMTESTVGISAIAQLLPMLDFVDMDGAALLARDIATGARLEQGVCRFAQANGTGVELLDVSA